MYKETNRQNFKIKYNYGIYITKTKYILIIIKNVGLVILLYAKVLSGYRNIFGYVKTIGLDIPHTSKQIRNSDFGFVAFQD